MNTRVPTLAVAGAALICMAIAYADDVTALNPLLPPLFSLDPASPEVVDGLFQSGDLLLPTGPVMPAVEIPAMHLSLFDAADDVNALGLGAADVAPSDTFVMIFSVDRAALGGIPPDPTLVTLGFPFNVQDQAAKNQAASDAFMSLLLFDRSGPIPPPPTIGSHSPNNTVVVNGGDAGGVDFYVSPDGLSPSEPNPDDQSDVDSGAGTQEPASPADDGNGPPLAFNTVFFSLAAGSPSLFTLPGTGSAADIYVDVSTGAPGGEELYVEPFLIGLTPADDIDALVIFEDGNPGFTPGSDQIVFSLTPESPTLGGTFGPGDLFTSEGFGVFELYSQGNDLGLAPADNLNMLDFVRCDDVLTCVQDWAIGFVGNPCPWDLDDDGWVGLSDLALLLSSYDLCAGDPGYVPVADLVPDGCINLADLAELLAHYDEACNP